jgi:hypothetical protein
MWLSGIQNADESSSLVLVQTTAIEADYKAAAVASYLDESTGNVVYAKICLDRSTRC